MDDDSAPQQSGPPAEWTLDGLVRRVALVLSGAAAGSGGGAAGTDAAGPPWAGTDGRPREAPDQRAVRWYISIGVMDRPIGGRGRGARYGPRHLCQLVALRRLQEQGLTLAAIQARLAGADDETLQALAAVPPALWGPLLAGSLPEAVFRPSVADAARPGPGSATVTRFWVPSDVPPLVVGPGGADHRPRPASATSSGTGAGAGSVPGVPRLAPEHVLGGLRLAEGVVLVLPRQPLPAHLPVLAEAAAPLLAVLTSLGLVPDPTTGVPR